MYWTQISRQDSTPCRTHGPRSRVPPSHLEFKAIALPGFSRRRVSRLSQLGFGLILLFGDSYEAPADQKHRSAGGRLRRAPRGYHQKSWNVDIDSQ